MTNLIKHFVHFLSPGTFVAETTVKEIDAWDCDEAMRMADAIVERHAATPYAFYFTTKERGEEDFDSRRTEKSSTYHLGGELLTVEDIEKENNRDNAILLSNMRSNHTKVVRNTNSWLHHAAFEEGDVLLKYIPKQKDHTD